MINRRVLGSLFLTFAASGLAAQERNSYDDPADARGCIGGSRCGGSRARLRVRLEDRRVSEVTFRAHDDIGSSRNGRLRVKIDDTVIESVLEISSRPEWYKVDVRGARGRELVFEPMSNDEVEITDVRVDYGRGGGGDGGNAHEGGCIGGSQCGGRRSSLRIPLRSRPIREVTFYAHDDIGNRRNGRLRVRIDDTPIETSLEITRARERYTLDADGLEGRQLIIEPASDDEVEVTDIRIRYRR